jgi:hypothetical protein
MGETMDDTTASAVLARQVRDQILFHPESHQQDTLGVGEVVGQREMGGEYRGHYFDVVEPVRACVAGWACHLSGDQMIVPQRGHDYVIDENERQTWAKWLRRTYSDGPLPHVIKVVPAGVFHTIGAADRASDLLELDPQERRWLFADERTREEVLQALDLLGKGDRVAFGQLVPRHGDSEVGTRS